MEKFYIIDCIGPFLINPLKNNNSLKLNWSKIIFDELETNGELNESVCRSVYQNFEKFIDKAVYYGFNSIYIDDLAHLSLFDFYSDDLKQKIRKYQLFYGDLFNYAKKMNMNIFLTTDIIFWNKFIENRCKTDASIIKLLLNAVEYAFKYFPQITGIIYRIGESDGLDVRGDFKSRIVLTKTSIARKYVEEIVKMSEKYKKYAIIRTWTVGGYEIGDLMWNQKTYYKVFGKITSNNLIISQKFGDTDFFRYLELNSIFFDSSHQKIIELQTRREYEGFGEFPSFIGYDYEKYYDKLKGCKNMSGILVWCQTGGWSKFKKLTFLHNSSIWNDINTYTTIKIFKNGYYADRAIIDFCLNNFPNKDPHELINLLLLSDKVIKKIWYMPEFSSKKLYFRRLRVPPLIWIFWDTILINHTLRKVLKRFVSKKRRKFAIHNAYESLSYIKEMKINARKLGINESVFDFQYDTFRIIVVAREYFLGRWRPEIKHRLKKLIKDYNLRYKNKGFVIEYDFSPVNIKKPFLKLLFFLTVRNKPAYRSIDKCLLKITSYFFNFIFNRKKEKLPDFSHQQAMGIQHIFK